MSEIHRDRVAVVINGNAKDVTRELVDVLDQIIASGDLFVTRSLEEGREIALEIVAGRWFSPADDGAAPVVLDRDLAVRVFGSAQAAIGQSLEEAGGPNLEEAGRDTPTAADRRQVVGVVADYRAGGELSGPGSFFFERVRVGDTAHRPPGHILLRLRLQTLLQRPFRTE